ncbi:MAG: class I SAM-dependent methyltransferase [Actinomycetota bacterium]|nr:methyltransferase [Actinomycetota bacterium]MDP8954635.1 class I SAM-dependent methyltransferase [Actinomycetota bacterium]
MSHYFDPEPSVPSQPRQVTLVLPDLTVELTTDRGVFAGHAVDPGTRFLLLEAPPPPARGELLDLGCGYGPIAVTLALRSPGATVWAVDVNHRALELTTANARAGGAVNVRACEPDAVPPDVRFAAIWANPPVRIGKPALQALLSHWLGRLAPGGRAWLVVHKHLGADSLLRWLGQEGFATERRRSRRGYRLLEVQARATA